MEKNTQLTNPIVSVVIPVYCEEKYILRSLTSLYNQSCNLKLFRIIIVDNNSSDGTIGLICEFKKTHPNLSITIIHEKKQGIAYARKCGFDFAKNSEIICTIDAESYVSENFIEEIINVIRTKKCDGISWGFILDWKLLLLVSEEIRYVNNKIIKVSKRIKRIAEKLIGNSLQGSAYAITYQKYKELGGIELDYKGPLKYADDLLLSQRLKYSGGKIYLGKSVVEVSGRRLLVEPKKYLTGESHWGSEKLRFYQSYAVDNSAVGTAVELLKRRYYVVANVLIRYLLDSMIYSNIHPDNDISKNQYKLLSKYLGIKFQNPEQVTESNWSGIYEAIPVSNIEKIVNKLARTNK